MSALYRLKAYFGMVPAEELDDYAYGDDDGDLSDDYSYRHDYEHGLEPGFEHTRRGNGHGKDWEQERPDRYRGRWSEADDRGGDRPGARLEGRLDGRYQADGYYDDDDPASARRASSARGWAADPQVRGALAVDPNREREPAQNVVTRARPAPAEDVHPLARITTLHPSTYSEARTIGEHYREGIPVIMNLTALEDADARRLVDFAAGLAFALRGSIDKITTKVFLLSPPNVDVTAEDRRRLAEGGFLKRSQ